MVTEPPAPRRGRPMLVAGVVLAVLALIVGVASVVLVVQAVARPLSEQVTSPARVVPVDAELSMRTGRYTVFELVGRRSGTTIEAGMVEVTGPDGATIPVEPFGSGSTESLDRNGDDYEGAVRFWIEQPGQYRVRVDAPAGTRVVIAPALGSGLTAVLGWFVTGIVALPVLLLGAVLMIVGASLGRRPAVQVRNLGPPPGWYSAPDVPGRQRYWDGRAWTDQPH